MNDGNKKFCVNCKYIDRRAITPLCTRDAVPMVYMVTGGTGWGKLKDARTERQTGACGQDGVYFVQKDSVWKIIVEKLKRVFKRVKK